jgi:uncharacterized protein
LQEALTSGTTLGLPDFVKYGVLRVSRLPLWSDPAPIVSVVEFLDSLEAQPGCVRVEAGPSHWRLVVQLAALGGLRANDTSDAVLAAFAIEQDAELITADQGFKRFPGLRFRHPLER